jgi:hypothetical protein
MRVMINAQGKLIIKSETETESYALQTWAGKNIPVDVEVCPKFRFPNMILDWSFGHFDKQGKNIEK